MGSELRGSGLCAALAWALGLSALPALSAPPLLPGPLAISAARADAAGSPVAAPPTEAPGDAPAAAAAPAAAEPPSVMDVDQTDTDEQAKAHFRVGKSLYDSGRFSEAAAEWQKSYQLSQRPELLYNIYVAHRDASEGLAATQALRSYLQLADVEPSRRVNLEARLRALEEAREEEPSSPDVAAPESPEAAEPGEAAPEAALQATDEDQQFTRAILPYALIGVGGSMLVAGGVTGLMTMSKLSEIEDDCPDERCPAGYRLDGKRGEVEDLALVTDVLLIGGGALAAVGTVLLILDAGESAPEAVPPMATEPVASLGCSATGCMASVRGRF